MQIILVSFSDFCCVMICATFHRKPHLMSKPMNEILLNVSQHFHTADRCVVQSNAFSHVFLESNVLSSVCCII